MTSIIKNNARTRFTFDARAWSYCQTVSLSLFHTHTCTSTSTHVLVRYRSVARARSHTVSSIMPGNWEYDIVENIGTPKSHRKCINKTHANTLNRVLLSWFLLLLMISCTSIGWPHWCGTQNWHSTQLSVCVCHIWMRTQRVCMVSLWKSISYMPFQLWSVRDHKKFCNREQQLYKWTMNI